MGLRISQNLDFIRSSLVFLLKNQFLVKKLSASEVVSFDQISPTCKIPDPKIF